jgi:hypothetical protein
MDKVAPVDGSTPSIPQGIAEALTAHFIRQEALHRAEHDLPTNLTLGAMTAAISSRVTAAAARAKAEREAAAQAPSPSSVMPVLPRRRRAIEGPFGLPWF